MVFCPLEIILVDFIKNRSYKEKKSLPVRIRPSHHVSGLVMPQIAAWGLISWLVSLGFLYPDASAFELIAIKILNSLISIFTAAVVDKGEASRFPKLKNFFFFFFKIIKIQKFAIFDTEI